MNEIIVKWNKTYPKALLYQTVQNIIYFLIYEQINTSFALKCV